MTRERRRSDAVNEPRRVAAAAAAGEAGKGADDGLRRQRLPGNGGNDAREGGCMYSRVLRVPTVSRSTAENSVELNVDRNNDDERRAGSRSSGVGVERPMVYEEGQREEGPVKVLTGVAETARGCRRSSGWLDLKRWPPEPEEEGVEGGVAGPSRPLWNIIEEEEDAAGPVGNLAVIGVAAATTTTASRRAWGRGSGEGERS